jgi:DNA-binding transcriptional regulator YdaS (Cro superfamily)
MNLIDYLTKRGLAASLAKELGVSTVVISQWKTEKRKVPTVRCLEIEKATDGAVRCEDLRPDIDWARSSGARVR